MHSDQREKFKVEVVELIDVSGGCGVEQLELVVVEAVCIAAAEQQHIGTRNYQIGTVDLDEPAAVAGFEQENTVESAEQKNGKENHF